MVNSTFFKRKITLSILVLVVVLGFGITGYVGLEDYSFSEGLYMAVITLSTVGYGDIHAVSATGQGLALLVIVLGAGSFLGVIVNATEIILDRREGNARFDKRNMVIGVFINDVGTRLLSMLHSYESEAATDARELCVTPDWTEQDYSILLRCTSSQSGTTRFRWRTLI